MHLPPKPIPRPKRYIPKNWFTAENQGRQRTPITSFHFWYHSALMPGASFITKEHLELFAKIKLSPVNICFLGSDEEIDKIKKESPVELVEHYRSTNLQEYEHPTIQKMWEFCVANPTTGVGYAHAKGASAPQDAIKANWRRVMTEGLLWDWEKNAFYLNKFDLVGCNWSGGADFPHFTGTFFFARGDWISHLRSPAEYKRIGQHILFAGQCWDRMHAEFYVGHMPYHHVKSLVTMYEWWETFARRGIDGR